MSKSQQRRFAARKDPHKRARKTKKHADKTKYERKRVDWLDIQEEK
jgi:hypothetical protein